MISQHPYRAADTDSLSDLRSGSRLIGVRLIRDIVRTSDPVLLVKQARHAMEHLLDEISAVARDDSGPEGLREKAAEFIVFVRARQSQPRSVQQIVNRVAEAAARARYRSSRIVDFLSIWLFAVGEQFIAAESDPKTVIELELAHLDIWSQVRANILEVLEAGTERMKAGRRFRLAEVHLARFRLVRARNEERARGLTDARSPRDRFPIAREVEEADYVGAMIVDLFALSLGDIQQRLIVSQIPNKTGLTGRAGFGPDDHRRLWGPIRAVRTDQAYERWTRLRKELALHERQAVTELVRGMIHHLERTWTWFFPDRSPFGLLRATLRELESAIGEETSSTAEEETIDRLFQLYGETLSYIKRLATEDTESDGMSFENQTDSGGMM